MAIAFARNLKGFLALNYELGAHLSSSFIPFTCYLILINQLPLSVFIDNIHTSNIINEYFLSTWLLVIY